MRNTQHFEKEKKTIAKPLAPYQLLEATCKTKNISSYAHPKNNTNNQQEFTASVEL